MTAWQYFAGAGLVAALCPLQGHVAVAGEDDGDGYGARVDLCVPAGRPERPVFRPPSGLPSVRVVVPGAERPTVRHPGRPAGSAAPAERPVRPADPAPPSPPGGAAAPYAEARAGGRSRRSPRRVPRIPPRRRRPTHPPRPRPEPPSHG